MFELLGLLLLLDGKKDNKTYIGPNSIKFESVMDTDCLIEYIKNSPKQFLETSSL